MWYMQVEICFPCLKQKKYDSVTNLCLEKEKQVVKLSLSLSKLRSSFSLKILSACKENITNVC